MAMPIPPTQHVVCMFQRARGHTCSYTHEAKLVLIMATLPSEVMQVFACTVGQKPSKAPFYTNDTADVASLLARLSEMPHKGAQGRLKPSGKGLRRV